VKKGTLTGLVKGRSLWLVVCLLALGLAAFAVVGCGGDDETTTTAAAGTDTTGAQPTGEPIVFGAIVSATGPNAPLGEPERNVLEMMEEQINNAGGVLGRPLDIVIIDDKSDAKEAVTAANRLLDQENAVALIAATGSPSTLAVKPITAEKGIPQLAMAAANEITDEPPMEWIWRTPPNNRLPVERALTYISETLGVTKVAILYDENAFGASGAEEIENQAGDFGLEIVAKESYKTDDTDLTAQLTKIKGNDPEVVVVWGTNPGPALAAKNMQQLNMDVPYVGSHGIANKTFIDQAGDAAEGVVFPAGKLLVPSSITDPEQKAVVDKFIADYEAAYGAPPNTFAGHAFDATRLLVEAITVAGSTDPAAIQEALNSISGFPGTGGIYNYTPTNHDGITVDDLIDVKIENGSWVLAQ
jgi:branched-chain amino acid transport system substrate-binding protein